MSELTREGIEARLEEIREAVAALAPTPTGAHRDAAERLAAGESDLAAVAFILGVSAERAAEIAASVPWSVDELRLRCAAGWQPRCDPDLPEFEELRALAWELRKTWRPEVALDVHRLARRIAAGYPEARDAVGPATRPPRPFAPPVQRQGRRPLVCHRVSPRRDRARSRPGGKSAARGLR